MLLLGNFSISSLIAIGIVLFFGMGMHEYAHAVVANWWGDPTPAQNGRLTPNPIVHINWVGWLMFLFIGFGMLGSVPVDYRKMRDPRWGNFWTSAAGPLSNLFQALVFGILFRFVGGPEALYLAYGGVEAGTINGLVPDFISLFLYIGVVYNVLLFIFNLLPLYPIDGWHMVLALLPGRFMDYKNIPGFIRQNAAPLSRFLQEPAYKWQQWAQVTQYAFMGLILISIFAGQMGLHQLNIFGLIIGQPLSTLTRMLTGI